MERREVRGDEWREEWREEGGVGRRVERGVRSGEKSMVRRSRVEKSGMRSDQGGEVRAYRTYKHT